MSYHSVARSSLFLLATLGMAVAGAGLRGQTDFRRLHGVVEVGGRLFFAAERAKSGLELWVTNAAQSKATLVRDINPGVSSAKIGRLLVYGDRVVFAADDGKHGRELWISDGTELGTTMVKDFVAGADDSGLDFAHGACVVGKTIYVFANDAKRNRTLCKTDGTAAGTTILATFEASCSAANYSHRLTALPSGTVVFRVRAVGKGSQLWRTDGTARGTFRLTDVVLADESGPFGVVGKRLFFAGAVGNAWDIWFTDGEKDGTRKLHVPAAAAAGGAIGGPKPTPKEHRLAKVHFLTYCVTCHGKSGKGDGPAAIALNPRPRNWTDPKWQASVTDKRILEVVRDGGAAVGLSPLMAPNPMYQKNPAVLKALVRLIRKFDPTRKK